MSERASYSKQHQTRRRAARRLFANTRGATSIEYGLIVALIFLTMVASAQGVANITVSMWNNISTKVQNAH